MLPVLSNFKAKYSEAVDDIFKKFGADCESQQSSKLFYYISLCKYIISSTRGMITFWFYKVRNELE